MFTFFCVVEEVSSWCRFGQGEASRQGFGLFRFVSGGEFGISGWKQSYRAALRMPDKLEKAVEISPDGW